MNTWTGGIHKHPNGYYAYVPRKDGGAGYRVFRKTHEEAVTWQKKKSMEEWGAAWPAIKATGGYKSRLLARDRSTKNSVKVAPGVSISRRERKSNGNPTGTYENLVRVTYMELSHDGKKRQRMRTFSFGTDKSKYSLKEAISAAVKLRKEKEALYAG